MSEQCLLGKDGFIFLRNDANQVLDQIQGRRPFSGKILQAWRQEFEKRQEHAHLNNYKYYYLIVPNKHCVYPEKLPDGIGISENRSARQLEGEFPKTVSYPLAFIQGIKDKEPYFKHDTHWTRVGAVETLNMFLGKLTGVNINYTKKRLMRHGDLGDKLSPPLVIECPDIDFEKKHALVYDNKIRNTGRVIFTENRDKSLPTAVIFGDSFFTDHVDLLGEYFSKLYYFHGSVFDKSIIERIHPDIVISENVERFLTAPEDKSFAEIFINKCQNLEYRLIHQVSGMGKTPESCSGLDYGLIYRFVNEIKASTSKEDFENRKNLFLQDNKILPPLQYQQNLFTGALWRGNESTRFTGWGAGFYQRDKRNPAAFAFVLENLMANSRFQLEIYENPQNIPAFSTEDLNPVYAREYLDSQLDIKANWQEIYFKTPDLFLEAGKHYLVCMEGDGFLGCGHSWTNMPRENFLSRGYFKQEAKYLAIAHTGAVAWRQIFSHDESFGVNPGLMPLPDFSENMNSEAFPGKEEEDGKAWNLPRKEMRFTGAFWKGDLSTAFNGWGAGYIHQDGKCPKYIAAMLQNAQINTKFRIRIYKCEDNKKIIDTRNLPCVYEKIYFPEELGLYAHLQEVFFPVPGISLEKGLPYFISIEGDVLLGAGCSYTDLPKNDHFFRGYFKKRKSPVFYVIANTQALAWRVV